jgi:hypothetical protein
MVVLDDVAAEIQGRNEKLKKLAANAANETRRLFYQYIRLSGELQLNGGSTAQYDRLNDLIAEVAAQSADSFASAKLNMQELLSLTSRSRMLDLKVTTSLPPGPSYARFAWILGVAGATESDERSSSLHDYFLGAAAWYSESLISMIVNPQDSNLLSIDPAARHGRMEASGVKFRWVCDLFAEGIDEWATQQGGLAAELFGGGRTNAFSRDIRRELPLPSEAVLAELHPTVRAALIAVPKPSADFATLIEGNGPEIRPLISIDGRTYIGNASALVMSRETLLIAAIQETLGSGAQGDAFEFACDFIARSLLPPTFGVTRDAYVSDTMSATAGDEVDLYLRGKGVHVIAEAKSHLPAKDASAAANSFAELSKANRQVKRRVNRIRDGKWIQRTRSKKGDHVSGFVVALHDYTGQVWKPESMIENGDGAFAAFPVHAFAAVLGAMITPSDLASFLSLRTRMGDLSMSGGDELETLLGWLSGWRSETLPDEPHSKVQVRPYSLETDDLVMAEWISAGVWREYLRERSTAVHA